MRFKNKGWCFLGASLLIHLCLAYLISFMPYGQGLSLRSPGNGYLKVKILGSKGCKKAAKKGKSRTSAKRSKRAIKKTAMEDPHRERKKTNIQKVKPSPALTPSIHQGENPLTHESSPLSSGSSTEKKAAPAVRGPMGSGFQTNESKGEGGTGGIIPPVPIQREKPPYPLLARKMGYEGRLILRLLVSKEGKVEQVKVIRSSGYSILDRAAIKTVKRWRFIPAHGVKKAVPFWVEVPVVFSLKGAG